MKNFDQKIKEKLSQPQVPPLDAWENIEKKLEENKKKRIFPIWITSAAASVAAIVAVYFFGLKNNAKNTHKIEIVKSPVKKSNSTKNKQQETKLNSSENDDDILINNKENQLVNSTLKKHQNIYKSPIFVIPNPLILDESDLLIKHSNDIKKVNRNDDQIQEEIAYKKNNIAENKVKEEQSFEDIITKEEEKIQSLKKTDNDTKLLVTTYVSPVILVNKNSILSQEFDLNKIDNNITTAYGAHISYQINDKLKVKSGIAKINLDQMTKDVITSEPAIASLTLSNQTIERARKQNIRYHTASAINSSRSQISALNSPSEVNIMNQQIEFLEIPLEMEYELFKDKKISIGAAVGGSYYLLTKNNIILTNPMLGSRSIGEATNINNSHFSANAGVKFGYDFNQKISLTLQPNVRFFMNQFQNSNQNTPTIFGINLGLSFKIK